MPKTTPGKASAAAAIAAAGLSLFVAACGSSSPSAGATSPASGKRLHLAYFSFAVQNSYDASILAAAKKAAAAANAQLTVFDANNNPQTQYGQVQDAIAKGTYDGFMIQAIDGAGLMPLAKEAVSRHVQVVAVSQVLGPDQETVAPQVPGEAASVVNDDYADGTRVEKVVEQACASLRGPQCNVGYLYDVKASTFDQARRAGFDSAIGHDPRVKVVAEGQANFTASGGLQAAQTMLQGHPDINIMFGSDQAMEGATSAIRKAARKVLIVGEGGSVPGLSHVKDGSWFGDVVVQPASQGKVAVEDLVKAVRTGQRSGGLSVEASLPNNATATHETVAQFAGQWAG
jgi:ribose transport system substrate-binding protein